MTYFFDALIVLHFIGWAVVLGGWVLGLRAERFSPWVFHGAATALVTGALAWLITLPGWVDGDYHPAFGKMLAKLVVAFLVAALAWIAVKGKAGSEGKPPRWAGYAMGVFILVNIVIAVFWR